MLEHSESRRLPIGIVNGRSAKRILHIIYPNHVGLGSFSPLGPLNSINAINCRLSLQACIPFIPYGADATTRVNIISYNYLIILFIIGCYLYLLVASVKLLGDADRTEKNVDVLERLLLVRRVLVDNEQAGESR